MLAGTGFILFSPVLRVPQFSLSRKLIFSLIAPCASQPRGPSRAVVRFNGSMHNVRPTFSMSFLMKFLLPIRTLAPAVKRLVVLLWFAAIALPGTAGTHAPCAADGQAHADALPAGPGFF
jgi:hypothetical protein